MLQPSQPVAALKELDFGLSQKAHQLGVYTARNTDCFMSTYWHATECLPFEYSQNSRNDGATGQAVNVVSINMFWSITDCKYIITSVTDNYWHVFILFHETKCTFIPCTNSLLLEAFFSPQPNNPNVLSTPTTQVPSDCSRKTPFQSY